MVAGGRAEFATAGRIIFGRGTADDAPAIVTDLGRRVLVVTGSTAARAASLVCALAGAGADSTVIEVCGEPDVAAVVAGAALARQHRINVVVSIGGGSAIDAGKAISALAANEGDPFDFLEVVGQGKPLTARPLPFVAIPTTAGTGSEVTRNAVLAVPGARVKVSLRSPLMLPTVAIVDPDLTIGLPADLTAQTGLDALTQVIEPFVSNRATALTDGFCRDGIMRVARSLCTACARGTDPAAREDMAFASLCGGLALANAGLGVVHGLAGPVGGMFKAPHGAVCAAILPHGIRANIVALQAGGPHHLALDRYAQVAAWLTGKPEAPPEAGVAWVAGLIRDLGIPGLSAWGLTGGDLAAIADQAARSSSMKGNPVTLSRDELIGILANAL
jgi:alcohol dehydrogenase class IV